MDKSTRKISLLNRKSNWHDFIRCASAFLVVIGTEQ